MNLALGRKPNWIVLAGAGDSVEDRANDGI
jgi:hypothetical protein